jgi:hypothetical protein
VFIKFMRGTSDVYDFWPEHCGELNHARHGGTGLAVIEDNAHCACRLLGR